MKHKILLLTILLSFFGCNLLTDSSETSTATNKTVIIDRIEYSLNIPTNVYSLYDTLNISFQVKNISGLPKVFNFSNVQQLGFQLIDRSNNVTLYYPFIVAPATSSFSLRPNETKELTIASLFKDHSGNFIKKGKFILYVFLLDNNSPKLKLEIYVN